MEKNFEYYDLNKTWNYDGKVKDIEEINESSKLFSEGAYALEECLKSIWKNNVLTKACCKGNHISINYESNPEIQTEAYIMFDDNSDWKSYLSLNLINDLETVIDNNTIYHFGEDHDSFFSELRKSFMTGKKNNEEELKNKEIINIDRLRLNSFTYSIRQIGFTEEQQIDLQKKYFEIYETLIKLDQTDSSNKTKYKLLNIKLNHQVDNYYALLRNFIKTNNRKVK